MGMFSRVLAFDMRARAGQCGGWRRFLSPRQYRGLILRSGCGGTRGISTVQLGGCGGAEPGWTPATAKSQAQTGPRAAGMPVLYPTAIECICAAHVPQKPLVLRGEHVYRACAGAASKCTTLHG